VARVRSRTWAVAARMRSAGSWCRGNCLAAKAISCVNGASCEASGEIKVALLQIAKKEGRSLTQACELPLRGEIHEYVREKAPATFFVL
jgi:hypothetical protein